MYITRFNSSVICLCRHKLYVFVTDRKTLDQLLKINLPAKFAMTGHIDADEKLGDGFYDSGYLKRNEPFIPIHEMSYETRDPKRRVIYLNLTDNIEPIILYQNVLPNI